MRKSVLPVIVGIFIALRVIPCYAAEGTTVWAESCESGEMVAVSGVWAEGQVAEVFQGEDGRTYSAKSATATAHGDPAGGYSVGLEYSSGRGMSEGQKAQYVYANITNPYGGSSGSTTVPGYVRTDTITDSSGKERGSTIVYTDNSSVSNINGTTIFRSGELNNAIGANKGNGSGSGDHFEPSPGNELQGGTYGPGGGDAAKNGNNGTSEGPDPTPGPNPPGENPDPGQGTGLQSLTSYKDGKGNTVTYAVTDQAPRKPWQQDSPSGTPTGDPSDTPTNTGNGDSGNGNGNGGNNGVIVAGEGYNGKYDVLGKAADGNSNIQVTYTGKHDEDGTAVSKLATDVKVNDVVTDKNGNSKIVANIKGQDLTIKFDGKGSTSTAKVLDKETGEWQEFTFERHIGGQSELWVKDLIYYTWEARNLEYPEGDVAGVGEWFFCANFPEGTGTIPHEFRWYGEHEMRITPFYHWVWGHWEYYEYEDEDGNTTTVAVPVVDADYEDYDYDQRMFYNFFIPLVCDECPGVKVCMGCSSGQCLDNPNMVCQDNVSDAVTITGRSELTK